MKLVDNYSLLKKFLVEDPDWFYFILIIQRKKEHDHLGKNNRVIKHYYVSSSEKLDRYYDEIKELCKEFRARAYIYLTPRSYKKVGLQTLKNVAERCSNEQYKDINRAYATACGELYISNRKLWVVDCDSLEDHVNYNIQIVLRDLNIEEELIQAIVPTLNGFHYICKPFNTELFNSRLRALIESKTIEIHKNNPTILYGIK